MPRGEEKQRAARGDAPRQEGFRILLDEAVPSAEDGQGPAVTPSPAARQEMTADERHTKLIRMMGHVGDRLGVSLALLGERLDTQIETAPSTFERLYCAAFAGLMSTPAIRRRDEQEEVAVFEGLAKDALLAAAVAEKLLIDHLNDELRSAMAGGEDEAVAGAQS